MVKKPPVAATKASHPIDNHENNDLLEISDPMSALSRAAGGGLDGVIVAVFLLFDKWKSLKI